jgi:hypothetical protein
MLFFLPFASRNLMIVYTQITKDSQNIQQQVNGYSPKSNENQWIRTSKMGGYSPKWVAETASFFQVGGDSPKSDAAAAKKMPKIHLFLLFLDEYLPK